MQTGRDDIKQVSTDPGNMIAKKALMSDIRAVQTKPTL